MDTTPEAAHDPADSPWRSVGGAFDTEQFSYEPDEFDEPAAAPWWLWAEQTLGLRTYHTSWASFLAEPSVLLAFLTIALTAVLLPLLGMFAYRFWRRKQNEKAGYVSVDANQPGRFNAELLDSLSQQKPKKLKRKTKNGHQQIPSDEADCNPDAESSSTSTCFSSPEMDKKHPAKLKGAPAKYVMSKEEHGSVEDPEDDIKVPTKSKKKAENITFDGTRIQNRSVDFSKLNDDEIKQLTEMQFHGKLASAKLRAKATKLVEGMSEEERKKEADLRNEQLEKIFSLMQCDQDKFGVTDKNSLMEQMKMYSL